MSDLDTYCGGYFTHFFDITKEIHTYMNGPYRIIFLNWTDLEKMFDT